MPPAAALLTISRPLSSSMCPITPETANVGSSYNRMRGPCIGCWFSDRSNCSQSLTLTFTLTSDNLSLYTTLLLLLVLIQLCSPRCWHLDSNYCRTSSPGRHWLRWLQLPCPNYAARLKRWQVRFAYCRFSHNTVRIKSLWISFPTMFGIAILVVLSELTNKRSFLRYPLVKNVARDGNCIFRRG